MSFLRHLRAIAFLPLMVLIAIPGLLLLAFGGPNLGWSLPHPFNRIAVFAGACFICSGLFLMFATIRLFAGRGRGTLAPWDPPKKLVVDGIYRRMRNPMITGVLCVLFGEVLLLGSSMLGLWFVVFLLANAIYIPLSEEPGLVRRFGADYLIYKDCVPRWIPRPAPWDGDRTGAEPD